MDLIRDIKSRINIKDLAVEYGLNPVRNDFIFSIYKEENNRSLKLYPETNSYYCFATGTGGDLIRFYADYWRIDFREAVKELADKALINRDQYEFKKHTYYPPRKPIQDTTVPILKSEKKDFEERFGQRSVAETYNWIMERRKEIQIKAYESLEKFCFGPTSEAMEYLQSKKRGLKPETIKKFRLFSIMNEKWTREYLKESFTKDELLISGLMNKKGYFVFSCHNLIIPYFQDNKIVYLRGRTLKTKGYFSKYISLSNFAGNLSLKRFYNMETLRHIYPNESLWICEGEFDTMIMEQRGFAAIGVPGVTNIPEDKIHVIKNYDLYLAFDNDEAGMKAVKRIFKMLNKPVNELRLKKNKDITELACSN